MNSFCELPYSLNIKDTLIFKNGEGDLNHQGTKNTKIHKGS